MLGIYKCGGGSSFLIEILLLLIIVLVSYIGGSVMRVLSICGYVKG